jgi:hypothetical protein
MFADAPIWTYSALDIATDGVAASWPSAASAR